MLHPSGHPELASHESARFQGTETPKFRFTHRFLPRHSVWTAASVLHRSLWHLQLVIPYSAHQAGSLVGPIPHMSADAKCELNGETLNQGRLLSA